MKNGARDFSFILCKYQLFNCFLENLRKSLREIYGRINEKSRAGINGYFDIQKTLNFKGNVSLFPSNGWRNYIVHHPREPMMDWGVHSFMKNTDLNGEWKNPAGYKKKHPVHGKLKICFKTLKICFITIKIGLTNTENMLQNTENRPQKSKHLK